MEAVLGSFPTCLAEDRALIGSMQRDGDAAADIFMVEIRAARKAALEARLDEVQLQSAMAKRIQLGGST